MKTAKEKALEVAYSLTATRVEALEEYMRGYFSTFERLKPFEKIEDMTHAISVMEKARIFIEYPDHEFAQDQEVKKHSWEMLTKVYRAEK